MKVAVISGENRQVGKTAISLLLSNIYPNASGRQSIYVTNKSLDEVLSTEKFYNSSTEIERSINVITELSYTNSISNEDIYDYAYRPTDTNAMLFDIYSTSIKPNEAKDKFMSVINKLGKKLILMDLNGSPYSEEVKSLINECDVVLYITTENKKDVLMAKEYFESLSENDKIKTKILCNMHNNLGLSKKSLQEVLKIRVNNILWFPYHYNIQRTMYEGRLCVLTRLIIEGKDDCLPLRQALKDILSFICDTNTLKVIKEVAKWE